MEAKLLNHLKADAIASSRESVLRALKAFYLPWALEGELSEAELRGLAQSAIEELQFRIFQINQRYLANELAVYPTAPTGNGAATTVQGAPPASPPPVSLPPHPIETTVDHLRQSINPAHLDDF
jgi:hypothetical protein